MKTFRLSLVLVVVFLFTSLPTDSIAFDRQSAVVSEVLSGDTVRLKGGKILKYAGIEAPPLQHKNPLIRTYGENSKVFNTVLVSGKKISIEWGAQIKDTRGNLLGYVFLADGRFLNTEILKTGHAKPRVQAPNLKYTQEIHEASRQARRNRAGLWIEEPKDTNLRTEFIGEKNTKVFYFPESAELSRIPQAQLVTFRSRVEAVAAGYRACPTCKDSIRTDEQSLY